MKVPVKIHHRELEEEVCYYDDYEKSIRCDNINTEYEYDIDEVEFDLNDLRDIVDEYFDDIAEILIKDKRYREKLLKLLKNISLEH